MERKREEEKGKKMASKYIMICISNFTHWWLYFFFSFAYCTIFCILFFFLIFLFI